MQNAKCDLLFSREPQNCSIITTTRTPQDKHSTWGTVTYESASLLFQLPQNALGCSIYLKSTAHPNQWIIEFNRSKDLDDTAHKTRNNY